jgi:hypothetical protein
MNNRSRAVLYLCFMFFLVLSGTAFSQEFYKGKTTPPLEKIQQICQQSGQYIGKYKDSNGVFHLYFYKGNINPEQLSLNQLDTDIWIASGYCPCAGCSRVITTK